MEAAAVRLLDNYVGGGWTLRRVDALDVTNPLQVRFWPGTAVDGEGSRRDRGGRADGAARLA